MGEERLQAIATRTGAMKPADLSRVIVDTTVQPKNITFPTDAKLVHRACEKLVKLAKRLKVPLRQSYNFRLLIRGAEDFIAPHPGPILAPAKSATA